MAKISIIVPVYNSEKFLSKCLESIINQTYKDIEIICVNDGSKDNSLSILQDYQKKDKRIVIIDKKNAGVSEARNDGIRNSTGEYITFVDSDDWLELNAIEVMYNTIIEKNVDVVRSNYYINNEYGDDISKGTMCGLENHLLKTSDTDFINKVNNQILNGKLLSYIWVLFIKKDVVLKTSLFPGGIVMMEDMIFYNSLMDAIESIYFLDIPTYHYYNNPSGASKSKEYYIRNAYNLVDVHELLINTIKKDKFENGNRENIVTTQIANKITGYMYNMYISLYKNKKELKNIMNELLENKKLYNIFDGMDTSILPIHLSTSIKLLMNKQYDFLFAFWTIRKKISAIKVKK